MNTISNVDLEAASPGDWYCTPLHQLELSFKAAYYVTQTLLKIEKVLLPPP